MQKIWLLVALSFIASKPIFTKQLLDLYSSNSNSVNTHTTFDRGQIHVITKHLHLQTNQHPLKGWTPLFNG
jgi:hypothetical protein